MRVAVIVDLLLHSPFTTFDAVATARERIAANVPEQLALEAMMLALLPRRVRTPRRR